MWHLLSWHAGETHHLCVGSLVQWWNQDFPPGTVPSGVVSMQGLDMGTTPGRGSGQSGECGGMVQRLVRMFKGEHSAEALQAASSGQDLQYRCWHGLRPCLGCCSSMHLHTHASASRSPWDCLRSCVGLPADEECHVLML